MVSCDPAEPSHDHREPLGSLHSPNPDQTSPRSPPQPVLCLPAAPQASPPSKPSCCHPSMVINSRQGPLTLPSLSEPAQPVSDSKHSHGGSRAIE